MQLWVPERYGGPERQPDDGLHRARGDLAASRRPARSIAGLNTMFIMPLLHFGSEEQRQRFLPIVAKGGVVTAIAISEPQAGSDVTAINTRARKDGDSYVLNGRKQWCSYGVVRRLHRGDGAHQRRSPGADGHQRLHRRAEEDAGHHASAATSARWAFAARPTRRSSSTTCACPPRIWSARKARASGRRCARSTSTARPSAPSRVGLAQGALDASRRLRQGAQAVQEAASRSSRACSSCWPTWRCRSRRRARWSTNARAPATPATGSA